MPDDIDLIHYDFTSEEWVSEDGNILPHLDPPELGDIRPTVEHHKDYASMARGNNYPFDEQIDYDPRIDNVDDDWGGNDE